MTGNGIRAGVVNVGIAGLGRSGWSIHAKTLERLPSQFRVAAVADSDAIRRDEAIGRFACPAYPDFRQLIADGDVELVVIATPSHVHAAQTIEALQAGKHVVCEKPMALTAADADRMIEQADRAGRTLTVFQNMRYWGDYRKVRELIESGKLGRIVRIRITLEQFSRRWDWQTLREFGGGILFNAGAHLTDLATQLFGPSEPQVWADLGRTLTSGDAEDHAKIILRGENAPTIEIEISNSCAYAPERWHVMGTAGGLHGTPEHLEWKWIDPSALPDRPADRSSAAADRMYNREDLVWQTDSWSKSSEESPDHVAFYRDLYETLRSGASVAITPQSVRRSIAVLEKCSRSAVRDLR
jgi:scyllo-inositol 2-dehydrogenase (NADP+)